MFLATLTNMSQKTFWINFGLIRLQSLLLWDTMVWVTVPENRNTVTSLDREEDEVFTTLRRSSNEKTYAKELNRPALQQKDTEIGTFALLDEPQSTLKNETLLDLVDETNQANNLSEKVDERSVNFKIVIGTLTSSNDTKGDLTICLNQHQTGGSLLKRITMVCA